MKIVEYLNTLEPTQEVQVVLGSRSGNKLLAHNIAYVLRASTREGWRRLEVIETQQKTNFIFIKVKDPKKADK